MVWVKYMCGWTKVGVGSNQKDKSMINSNEIIEVLDVLISKTINKEIKWDVDCTECSALVNGNKIKICRGRDSNYGNFNYYHSFLINSCTIYTKKNTEVGMFYKVTSKIEELYNEIWAADIDWEAEKEFEEFRKICLIEKLSGLNKSNE